MIKVALPSLAHGLGVRTASTSIVLSAYFAAYALALLPGGMLVDRFGARYLAVLGLIVFGVGAAAGAVSWDMPTLVMARAVLVACGACVFAGAPACAFLRGPARARPGARARRGRTRYRTC